MGKDQYLLYHPKFKKYVAFDPDSKPIFVFNPDKAKFFTHVAASNFMQKNAFGEFKFCNIIPCGGNVRQMLADASNTNGNGGGQKKNFEEGIDSNPVESDDALF